MIGKYSLFCLNLENKPSLQNLVHAINLPFQCDIKPARSRLIGGESLTHCEECEAAIPRARRKAIPAVRLCINCQAALEKQQKAQSGYNRRGRKDSQLKLTVGFSNA
jgi:phage/conjugal plasmid C-4 type zinc finger TraR family protein